MQKKIMICLSFIAQLIGIQTFAQDHATAKSLLWRISGKDLEKPSYVFGTIHAICSEDYFFTEKMSKAFHECNQLILEVNLKDPDMSAQLQEQMLLPEGKNLSDYFSNQDRYQLFATKLKESADIDIDAFSKFKPFVLISAMSLQGFSCPTTVSYEVNLMEMVKESDIKIGGLETATSQMEIFDKLSNEDIEGLLFEAIGVETPKREMDEQLIALYKEQDLQGIYKLMSTSTELKGHEAEFLTDRNKNWVKLLPAMIQKTPGFVAVGAAHLPGENGVLNLLKKAGYKVEPVN